MNVELINTGSELMLGRVLNTHQQWLCRQLSDLGFEVTRQVAVPDTAIDIQNAVRESLGRVRLIIVTGGLGPTSDDITRELIAQLLDRPLTLDQTVMKAIKGFFAMRKREMPERNKVQAMVPQGAEVLHNPNGTAPGLLMKVEPNRFHPSGQSAYVVMLPGPPGELRPMFTDQVAPRIRPILPPDAVFICRTLRVTGLGESLVEQRVAGPLQGLLESGLQLGYCARPGQVDVRLLARCSGAEALVSAAEVIVREQLGSQVYAAEDTAIEDCIVTALSKRKETLAVAESCTGGSISSRLTNIPGASAVFLAGLVTYSNEAKQQFLGVSADTIAAFGAVSEPVAREMAEGARNRTGAHYAISVTGIAGPAGGTQEKPVGTAFIGLAGPFPTVVERQFNPCSRQTFKDVTTQQALDLLRRKALG